MTRSRDTDRDWEQIGAKDPYWGVLSVSTYKSDQLNEESKKEFFDTGEQFIRKLFSRIHDQVAEDIEFKRTLDFGCGVGRLVAPLARRSEHVVGVDVSQNMLDLCHENMAAFGVDNYSLIKGDDTLSTVEGEFDLVNSYIVLQHIPTDRGLKLIDRLIALTRPGGVAAIHVSFARKMSLLQHEAVEGQFYRKNEGEITPMIDRPKQPAEGNVTMYDYDLNDVMLRCSTVADEMLCIPNFGNHIGMQIIFRRRPA